MRKHTLTPAREGATGSGAEGIDIRAVATASLTSEADDHPIENAFDGRRGPGATRWLAAEPGPQTLVLDFDAPQSLRRVELEVEEPAVPRTQELSLWASVGGGESYRELVRQEYTFSPPGTTFERESWSVFVDGMTQLKLEIVPDKSGRPCRASLTALVLR
jgi:hypothetical protein